MRDLSFGITRLHCPRVCGGPLFVALVALLAPASSALASVYSLFPAGRGSRAAGLESGIASRGAGSVLYNPAHLSLEDGDGLLAELGFARVSFAYENPDYDPVALEVRSPMGVAGFSGQVGERWSYGLIALPAKRSETYIPGLPKRVSGEVEAVETRLEQTRNHFGAGFSYEAPFGFRAGASAIHTTDRFAVKASLVGNVNTLAELEARSSVNRYVVGVSQSLANLQLAASYISSVTKDYEGNQELASSGGSEPVRMKAYKPAVLGWGIGSRLGKWQARVTVNHARWSEGSPVVTDGLGVEPEKADLRNVTEKSLMLGYAPSRKTQVTAAVADLPSPWGEGYYKQDDDLSAEYRKGVRFGQLNGVDQRAVSVGGEVTYGDYNVGLNVYRAAGEREVSRTGDNPGYYQLEVVGVTTSLRAAL